MNEMTVSPAQNIQPQDAPRPATSFNEGTGSLLSLLPTAVADSIRSAAALRPDLFDKTEQELNKYLKQNDSYQPTAADNRLRLKFWTEYDRVQQSGGKALVVEHIIAGICYREHFYGNYLKNPLKVAWIVCMPVGYWAKSVEALEFGIEQLRDILEIPHFAGGKLDTKLMSTKVKIVELMNTWIKGAPVQRSVAVNLHTGNELKAMTASMTMEDMQAKLKALEARSRAAQNLPAIPTEGVIVDAE